jgi:hypothetical protein
MFSTRSVGAITVALLLLVVFSAPPTQAFQPYSANEIYEIPLPEFVSDGAPSPDRDAGAFGAAQTLAERYGDGWHVYSWNRQTHTPHFAYGPSFPLAPALTDEADLEALAGQVVAANAGVLHVNPDDLRLTATPHALEKWVAHFQQTYHGLDVWGATVRVLFSDDGRLMLLGSDCYSDIDLDPVPKIGTAGAEAIARAAVPFNPATDSIEDGTTLMVLPYPLSETEVEQHLVWRVRVRTADPIGIWVTHVDARDGRILWRYNDIYWAYGGTTHAEVQHFGYCDGITGMTIPSLDIDVSGVGTVTSDADGNWSIAGTGGPRTVSCDLYGPYVDINNMATGAPEAFFSGTAQEDVPFTVTFDDTNAQHDERDVFDAVNDIHEFFQLFAPEFGYTNQRITANVSRNATCNAYWDGTINFYREGGGCANTGEMQQVVHHEFGHGVQNAILGGQGSQGLGEGNGDILGNLITQDHIIGRGFYLDNCSSGIRDAVNSLQYPEDVVGQEIHYAGQVIAGFNWDAMVLLQDEYGVAEGQILSAERWHYGRVLMHPTTQPDQVLATFIADDDNGDLDDGTPNHAIFCEAAQNHGFDCPEILVGVFIYHEPHPYTGVRTGSYDIVARAISMPLGDGAILPGTVALHYCLNGGEFIDAPMSPTGNPDEYAGGIPAQPWRTVVQYYISAEDDLDNYGTSPRTAPEDLHYFQVNGQFLDEMQWDTAWVVGDEDDDASSGIWVRVDPIGTTYDGSPVQLEDDHTLLGTDCFITGQHQAGQTAGYNDVDNGKTTLFSPRFDLTGTQDIAISYWRYYSNDKGNNPGEDWWNVDVSNDGGETWTSVEHTQTTFENWGLVSFDLADYFTDPGIVRLRFVASDPAGSGSLVEAGVDDFLLVGTFSPTDVDPTGLEVKVVTGMDQNRPNPFGLATQIRFRLEQPGEATLKVFDAAGRQVKTLASGALEAGEHQIVWNGTDEHGRPLATGTYFYRLETLGKVFTARMIVLH